PSTPRGTPMSGPFGANDPLADEAGDDEDQTQDLHPARRREPGHARDAPNLSDPSGCAYGDQGYASRRNCEIEGQLARPRCGPHRPKDRLVGAQPEAGSEDHHQPPTSWLITGTPWR